MRPAQRLWDELEIRRASLLIQEQQPSSSLQQPKQPPIIAQEQPQITLTDEQRERAERNRLAALEVSIDCFVCIDLVFRFNSLSLSLSVRNEKLD